MPHYAMASRILCWISGYSYSCTIGDRAAEDIVEIGLNEIKRWALKDHDATGNGCICLSSCPESNKRNLLQYHLWPYIRLYDVNWIFQSTISNVYIRNINGMIEHNQLLQYVISHTCRNLKPDTYITFFDVKDTFVQFYMVIMKMLYTDCAHVESRHLYKYICMTKLQIYNVAVQIVSNNVFLWPSCF